MGNYSTSGRGVQCLLDLDCASLAESFRPGQGFVGQRDIQAGNCLFEQWQEFFASFGGFAHTLILGMTGSGKSFLCNFLLTNAQKYRPQTYIFDSGGSFQSLTETFGGPYLNAGQASRNFTINPFS